MDRIGRRGAGDGDGGVFVGDGGQEMGVGGRGEDEGMGWRDGEVRMMGWNGIEG